MIDENSNWDYIEDILDWDLYQKNGSCILKRFYVKDSLRDRDIRTELSLASTVAYGISAFLSYTDYHNGFSCRSLIKLYQIAG